MIPVSAQHLFEMPTLKKFSQNMAGVVAGLGGADFCRRLSDAVRSHVPFDEFDVFVYEDGSIPIPEFVSPERNSQPNIVETFLNGAFFLDPFFVAATGDDEKRGFFKIHDLAPTAFRETE